MLAPPRSLVAPRVFGHLLALACAVQVLVGCSAPGAPVSEVMHASELAYAAQPTESGALSAVHAAMQLRATFETGRVSLALGDPLETTQAVELAALAWGCENAMQALEPSAPTLSTTRAGGVEYRHAGIDEWYVTGAAGVEQGFTIHELPECAAHHPLRIELAFRDTEAAHGEVNADGSEALLGGPFGETLHYGQAFAQDAAGAARSVRIDAQERLSLEVDAAGAALPLVVDPLAWVQVQKLSSSNAGTDYFGSALALSGDTVLVGAPLDDAAGTDAGRAYVYVKSGASWALQQTLSASDATADDHFGTAVALSGNLAVIGAPLEDNGILDSGAAYVFTRTGSTWLQTKKLAASDQAPRSHFGTAVAASNDEVIVGAPQRSNGVLVNVGVVYTFQGSGSTWTQQAKLIPTNAAGDQNGSGLALSGSTLVVGTDRANGFVVSYYSLVGNAWFAGAPVTSTDAQFSNFGTALALSSTYTVVGSKHLEKPTAMLTAGSALVVSNAAHASQYTLAPSDGAPDDRFGCAVAISETNRVLVGSCRDDDKGLDSGSVYGFVLNGTTFTQDQKLIASDGLAGDGFGTALAASGTLALVGAPSGKVGAAYVQAFGSTNGSACAQNSECGSGFCVEGVCCNTACSGTCQSCLQANKGNGATGATGVCGNVRGGIDPYDACQAISNDTCSFTGLCNGQGACAKATPGTSCTYSACAGPTNATLNSACNTSSECKPTATVPCQLGYECVAGTCKSGCKVDSDCDATLGFTCAPSGQCKQPKGTACTADVSCSTGTCQWGFCCLANADGVCIKPLGTPCAAGAECASGTCASGVCCSSSCAGQCQSCALPQSTGTCAAFVGAPGSACGTPTGNGGEAAGGDAGSSGGSGNAAGGSAGALLAGNAGFAEAGFGFGTAGQGSSPGLAGALGLGGDSVGGRSGNGSNGKAGAAMSNPGLDAPCTSNAECANGLACDPIGHTCVDQIASACGCRVPGARADEAPRPAWLGLPWLAALWRRKRRLKRAAA